MFTFVAACPLAGPPEAALYVEGSDGFVTSAAAPTATGWSDPVAGWESHPLKTYTFARRTASRFRFYCRQCELLGLNRSTYYLPSVTESEENLRLMRLIDEQYLKTPFYGSRRMAASLRRHGEAINRKRVQRLMTLMGLEGLHPGPRTTIAAPDARAYPTYSAIGC
jgi:hypothetical protein